MLSLLQSENLTRLGWGLLNSFWQMGILWLAYLLLTETNNRFTAAARHNLALIFSAVGSCWFVIGLAYAGGGRGTFWLPLLQWFRSGTLSVILSSLISLLTLLYLIRLLLWVGWYVQGFYHLRQSTQRPDISYSAALQAYSNRMSAAMGIRKRVRLLLVDWVDTAQTIGFVKPLILLPVALVNRLSMEQTEAILLHELLHIRRNDYLVNIAMTIFRTLFFFNPFALLFFKAMAGERENACDDGVLRWDYSSTLYAEALFVLEKFRQQPNSISLAAHGHNPGLLMERIRRVIGAPRSAKKYFSPFLSVSLAAALALFFLNAFAPSAKQPLQLSAMEKPAQARRTMPVVLLVQTKEIIQTVPVSAEKTVVVHRTKSPAAVHRHPDLVLAGIASMAEDNPDEEIPESQLHYTEKAEQRNFSNEKAVADAEAPRAADAEGMPYLPQASFSYAPLPDSLLPDVLLQNKLKAILVIGKIKTAELQAKLQQQISGNMRELRQLKEQSLRLLQKKQQSLQPERQRLEKKIQLKKQQIDRLHAQMQIPDGEIIVI